jgi:RNA polymerase sigma factor for flagellar operon FliA
MAAAAQRTQQERDSLVEQYLPLVRHVAARLPVAMPASLDRDDFYAVGVIGLMHAATVYDPARGASFKTFAYTAIRGAILDEIRRHDPVPRNRRDRLRRMERTGELLRTELGRPPTLEELAERLAVSPDELDGDLLAQHTCRMLSLDEQGAFTEDDSGSNLLSTVACDTTVDPRDAATLRDQITWLARAIAELPEAERNAVVLYHYENLYLKEIGAILGVTESRVSQVLSRATERLRLKLLGFDREK